MSVEAGKEEERGGDRGERGHSEDGDGWLIVDDSSEESHEQRVESPSLLRVFLRLVLSTV